MNQEEVDNEQFYFNFQFSCLTLNVCTAAVNEDEPEKSPHLLADIARQTHTTVRLHYCPTRKVLLLASVTLDIRC